MSVETSSPYNLRSRSNGSNNAARQERAERPTHTAGTELEEEAPSRPRSFSKSNFPHVRQRYDWDCGLVCCQMCLKWVDKAQTFAAITSRCTTQSTWSIDLAYLLHGYGIEARYFTITWGTDDSYQAIDYYKENLENDKARVNELFQRATEIGLHVEMRSVEMDQIIQAVRKETCVAIVLVDTQRFEQGCSAAAERRRKLGRGMEEGEEGALQRLPHSLPPSGIDRGFVGHYVVLVAYEEEEQVFEVSDPGVAADRRIIDRNALELARKRHGTDEDLLVIDIASLLARMQAECTQQANGGPSMDEPSES